MKLEKTFLIALKLIGYLLLAPIFFLLDILRLGKNMRRMRFAVRSSLTCYNCRSKIPLVGMWKCNCGFQYTGHVLKPCSLCGHVAQIVRCPHCGVTLLL